MADLSYAHGVTLAESAETPSLLRVQRNGITFVNGTAPNADAAAFPLNYPTLITSERAAAALGATGTLLEDVTSVFGEGGSWCIVNRVPDSADPAVQQANLLGDPVARTGLYAALRAKAITGYQPRVVITAGDTGAWIEAGVVSVSMSEQGAKLTEAPIVEASGGDTSTKWRRSVEEAPSFSVSRLSFQSFAIDSATALRSRLRISIASSSPT